MQAWLGLGANLQHPANQLKEALVRLGESDGIEINKVSSFYRTPPWGDDQQDNFINAVVSIETSLSPLSLLHCLQSIENTMGRRRTGRQWGPRIIDIDLLLFDDQVVCSSELLVPHPHMHERAFVLLPLAELDAEIEIPGQGRVVDLLSGLDCDGIFRLDGKDIV